MKSQDRITTPWTVNDSYLHSFDVILIDPPWQFQTWSDKGKDRSPEKHYAVMTLEDIYALPVLDMAAENCALFLWVTMPMLPQGLACFEQWSGEKKRDRFVYKTAAFTWVKSRRSGQGFHFGLGYYTRANSELCLLAVRGKMPVTSHAVSSLIYSPLREHSRKPDQVYEGIEDLYPNVHRLEMFARNNRPVWFSWGNECEHSIDLFVKEENT